MKSDINTYLHRFSKAVVAEGQLHQTQAAVRSGHNVSYSQVRAEEVPACFHRSAILAEDHTVKPPFDRVLKFWDAVQMVEFPYSNGETWFLMDAGEAVSDFVDPADRIIDGNKLSLGYTALVFGSRPDSDEKVKISPNCYEFESFSGVLQFKEGRKPADLGFDKVYLQAFSYVGMKIDSIIRRLEELTAMNVMLLQKVNTQLPVVQPYRFTTANMTRVGELQTEDERKYAKFEILVPGFVVGDIEMAPDTDRLPATASAGRLLSVTREGASTRIAVRAQMNADGTRCVLGTAVQTDYLTNEQTSVVVTGDIKFTVYSMKRFDNQSVAKDPVVLTGSGDTLRQLAPPQTVVPLNARYIVDDSQAAVDRAATELFDRLYPRR